MDTAPSSRNGADQASAQPGLPAAWRRLKTFDSFRNRAYRFFFLGMIGQWGSMNMEAVARSLLIYRITGSAAMLGIMSLVGAIPMVILSLFGGVIADRMPKKRLIQLSQFSMIGASFVTAVTISVGYLGAKHPESWWVLMAIAVIQGIIMAIAMPSRQAIIPELVGKEQIMNAVSLNTMGMSIFRLLGPGVAGVIIDHASFAAVYYVMGALNVAAVVFTAFLPNVQSLPRRRSVARELQQGLKYVAGHSTILLVLLFSVASVLLSMPYMMMLPIFADDILKVGATGQGVLISVSGIGALVASLSLASSGGKRRGLILLTSNLVLGVALTIFAFSTSWPLSLGLMVFVGVAQIGNNTSGAALLQTHTDPEYLGRVMSIMMMNFGLSSLGTFFAGILAQRLGAPLAIGLFAGVLAVASFAAFIFLPRVRRLD